MTNTIKPFAVDDREYTRIHNFVFAVLMPVLSPTAFKILALIVRATKGWRMEEEQLSYKELQAGTGIKSPTTIASGIQELLEHNCIIVTHGASWQKSTYAINRDAEYDASTPKNGVGAVTPKNGADATPKNGVTPTPKNGAFNRKKEISSKTTTNSTPAQPAPAAARGASAPGGGGREASPQGDPPNETERFLQSISMGRKKREEFRHIPLAVVQAAWASIDPATTQKPVGYLTSILAEWRPDAAPAPQPGGAEKPQTEDERLAKKIRALQDQHDITADWNERMELGSQIRALSEKRARLSTPKAGGR